MRRPARRSSALAALAAATALVVGLSGCQDTQQASSLPSIKASVGEAATNVNVISPILVQPPVAPLAPSNSSTTKPEKQ